MIRAQAISSAGQPGAVAADDALVLDYEVLARHDGLIARMLLATVLAGAAALIPGAAPRVLEGPLSWADVFRRRSTPGQL